MKAVNENQSSNFDSVLSQRRVPLVVTGSSIPGVPLISIGNRVRSLFGHFWTYSGALNHRKPPQTTLKMSINYQKPGKNISTTF